MITTTMTAPVVVLAQANPRAVQPERPTVATHAGTVAPGYLEIEAGVEWDRYSDRSEGSVAPLVFKFGVGSREQLSIFTSVVEAPGISSPGLGDLGAGLKVRLTDNAPVLGRFAVFPTIKFPTGSRTSGAGTGTTDVDLLLISSHDIGPVALDINAGYTRRSGDGSRTPRDATLWTVSTGGPAVGAVGWVVEVFGFPRTTGPAGQASTVATLVGPTLSVGPSLALDAGLVLPIAGTPPHAIYAGGVWNVGQIHR